MNTVNRKIINAIIEKAEADNRLYSECSYAFGYFR